MCATCRKRLHVTPFRLLQDHCQSLRCLLRSERESRCARLPSAAQTALRGNCAATQAERGCASAGKEAGPLCSLPETLLPNCTIPMLHQAALWLFFPRFSLFFQLVRLSVMHLQNTALLCHYNIFFFHYDPTLAGLFQRS